MKRHCAASALALAVLIASIVPAVAAPESLLLTRARLEALAAFGREPKFTRNDKEFYFGAPTEAVRARCQARVDLLVTNLHKSLPSHPTKTFVLSQMQVMLDSASSEDSEERDQTLTYMERILDILGIESSDGLLNKWRYGFDPKRAP